MSVKRDELVAAALDELADHGVTAMSLRPLARALGTSDRMLIHYFGTREGLISAVLSEAFDRLARVRGQPGGTVRSIWTQLTSDEAMPAVRLYLEASALAHSNPAAQQMLQPLTADWLRRLESWLIEDGMATAGARDLAGLVSACLDGCLLRLTIEGSTPGLEAVVASLEAVVSRESLFQSPVRR